MNSPLISVIIPVYNSEKYIATAIESILNQTYQSIEIIVVDDGSTDATASIVKQFTTVSYHYQNNSGASSALNKGISNAHGDYIAFLDADDFWTLDKLEQQIKVFVAQPDVEIVFSHLEQFYMSDTLKAYCDPQLVVQPGYSRITMLIKKAAFYKVGLFDVQFKMGEFIDWYVRARSLELKTHMMEEVLVYRRIHSENMGIIQHANREDYLKIVKARLAINRSKVV